MTARALEDTETIELGARALAQTLRRLPTASPAVLLEVARRSSLSFLQAYARREREADTLDAARA